MPTTSHGCRCRQVLEPVFTIPGFVGPFRRTFPSVALFYRPRVAGSEVADKRPAPDARFGGRQTSVKAERELGWRSILRVGLSIALPVLWHPGRSQAFEQLDRFSLGFSIGLDTATASGIPSAPARSRSLRTRWEKDAFDAASRQFHILSAASLKSSLNFLPRLSRIFMNTRGKQQTTKTVGNRKIHTFMAAFHASVSADSGAYSGFKSKASSLNTPQPFFRPFSPASSLAEAPVTHRPPTVAGKRTFSPLSRECFSSATRFSGTSSGDLTAVPTMPFRPRLCSIRCRYMSFLPKTQVGARNGASIFPGKKRLFDVVREGRVVRHREGGSDGVRNRIHIDSPDGHARLFRTPNLLQPVSVPDSVGEKLGMFPDEFVQRFPELFGIFDLGHIFYLIEGGNDCTIFPGSWFFF